MEYPERFGGIRTEILTGIVEIGAVPSYGVGSRFMAATAQILETWLEYGRSWDRDSVYLSALDAF